MTKRYSILRKKLREVESVLSHVFSLPVTTPCSDLLLEEIQQRFAFVKSLLSAEVASHPSKPHHLQHLSQRLEELERDFRAWESFRASGFDRADRDNGSGCSCTESCLNDDGEASGDDLGSPVNEEDPGRFPEGLIGEKALVGLNRENGMLPVRCFRCSFVEEKAKEERRVGNGSLCGAMAMGVVLGMALMGYVMARISGCLHYLQPPNFRFPTPT